MNINVEIYTNIILPFILIGCGTWCITLWVEHRMRLLKNRVLRNTLEPKGKEVTCEWRKLHHGFMICTSN
jgi:hypothetical protein